MVSSSSTLDLSSNMDPPVSSDLQVVEPQLGPADQCQAARNCATMDVCMLVLIARRKLLLTIAISMKGLRPQCRRDLGLGLDQQHVFFRNGPSCPTPQRKLMNMMTMIQ